ncbi:MAG: hypothetical protein RLZZ157_1358 [Pseudomonadota bacterium]|jgi:uncharacterized protein (DUF1499 family)
MTQATSRAVKVRAVFVGAGIVLAIFVPIWFVAAALGTKFGLWPWTVGLVRMTGGIGVPLIGLLIVLTFVTSLLVAFIKPRAGYGGLAFMWVVSLCAAGLAFKAVTSATAVPPIHDISTDTSAPLMPSPQLLAARGTAANKILPPKDSITPFDAKRLSAWSGRTLVDIQAEAYPAIKPLVLAGTSPPEAYAKALSVLKQQGLSIISEDQTGMRIEASAESFWFGFKDDVIVQLRAVPTGTQIDMRSISRVGISDLGQNAKRIENLQAALK